MTWVKQTAGWPTPVRLSVWLWRRIRTARALNPGDVVAIPAGLKHWHGAAKDSWFSHEAFEALGEGCSTEWCGPVDAGAYDALP